MVRFRIIRKSRPCDSTWGQTRIRNREDAQAKSSRSLVEQYPAQFIELVF